MAGPVGVAFAALLLTAVTAVSPGACRTPQTKALPFCDVAKDVKSRVADLVGRLTIREKLGLTDSNNAAISRLDIPEYGWGNECLHGTKVDGQPYAGSGATVFPSPIAWGATFDSELVEKIGGMSLSPSSSSLFACLN